LRGFGHRLNTFDTSSVVPLRSSSCLSPDLVFQAFSFRVHDLAFWTEPPKVVWNLLLQAGSEGPSLIDQTVAHSNSLLAALVLVAHYSRYPVQVNFLPRPDAANLRFGGYTSI